MRFIKKILYYVFSKDEYIEEFKQNDETKIIIPREVTPIDLRYVEAIQDLDRTIHGDKK